MRSLVLLGLCIYGCSEVELTLTEQDAIDLDFVAVGCPDVGNIRVYVEGGRRDAGDEACRDARLALAEARAVAAVPQAGMTSDSIVAAVVSRVRYSASTPGDVEEVLEGVHVVLDLATRDFNLLVVTGPGGGAVEIVPKGLRY